MELVVVDTSVVIDYLRGQSPLLLKLLERQKDKKLKLLLPAVVWLELEVGASMENMEIHEKVASLLSPIERIEVNEEQAVLAGQLIRRKKILTDPVDTLIAAAAVKKGAKLVTLNVKHYKNIPNLKLYK